MSEREKTNWTDQQPVKNQLPLLEQKETSLVGRMLPILPLVERPQPQDGGNLPPRHLLHGIGRQYKIRSIPPRDGLSVPVFMQMIDGTRTGQVVFEVVDRGLIRDGSLTQFMLGKHMFGEKVKAQEGKEDPPDNRNWCLCLGEFGIDGAPSDPTDSNKRMITFRFNGGLCGMQCAVICNLYETLLDRGVCRFPLGDIQNCFIVFFTVTDEFHPKLLVVQIINFNEEPITIHKYNNLVESLCKAGDWARTRHIAPMARQMELLSDGLEERACRTVRIEMMLGGGFFNHSSASVDDDDDDCCESKQQLEVLHVVAPNTKTQQQQQQQQQQKRDDGDGNDPSKRNMNAFNMYSSSLFGTSSSSSSSYLSSSSLSSSRVVSLKRSGQSSDGSASYSIERKSEDPIKDSLSRSMPGSSACASDGGGAGVVEED